MNSIPESFESKWGNVSSPKTAFKLFSAGIVFRHLAVQRSEKHLVLFQLHTVNLKVHCVQNLELLFIGKLDRGHLVV